MRPDLISNLTHEIRLRVFNKIYHTTSSFVAGEVKGISLLEKTDTGFCIRKEDGYSRYLIVSPTIDLEAEFRKTSRGWSTTKTTSCRGGIEFAVAGMVDAITEAWNELTSQAEAEFGYTGFTITVPSKTKNPMDYVGDICYFIPQTVDNYLQTEGYFIAILEAKVEAKKQAPEPTEPSEPIETTVVTEEPKQLTI